MTQLLVMRHAKSDWSTGLADHDRPLSTRGRRNAPEMACWLAESGYCPDRILTSSARRTQETVAAVIDECDVAQDCVVVDSDLYLASGGTWIDAIHEFATGVTPERLLICGHNPGLDALVDHLSDGRAQANDDAKLMTTAAIAVFDVVDWDSLTPDSCEFVELMRPRELDG